MINKVVFFLFVSVFVFAQQEIYVSVNTGNDSGNGTSSNGDDKIKLFDATDNNIANAYQGELTLLYPSNASTKTCVNFAGNRNDGHTSIMIGGGQRLNAEATDGIRFKANSGDMSIGTSITCYGIVK